MKAQILRILENARGKSVIVAIFLCALLGIALYGADSGVVSSNHNPLQIALLHWYDANQTASFVTGARPAVVAFDGASMWVTNETDGTVTKLRASDGTNLGTFTVGTNPYGLVFDGANVWAVNNGSNTVTKLRTRDGTVLGTFGVGSVPHGVAFDGANIWVTNENSNTVSKL